MTTKTKKKRILLTPKKSKSAKKNKPVVKKLVIKKPVAKVIKKVAVKKIVPKKLLLKKLVKIIKKPSKILKKQIEVIEKPVELPQTPAPYEQKHESVLLKEVLEHLDLPKKKIIVDATLGLGGHSLAILENLPGNGRLIAFEADSCHLQLAQKRLKTFQDQVTLLHANFVQLEEHLKQLKIKQIDGILFDLGLASPHVDDAQRGFSFMKDGPLDMRFDSTQKKTAAEIVNTVSEKELIRIFQEYGEETRARKIALEIVKTRKSKPYKTTIQLSKMIEKLVPREGHIHPATRVFQALRIAVNSELDVLQEALTQAVTLLKPDGRIAVISYHSLEDRIVKIFFKAHAAAGTLQIITKKPLVPLDEEVRRNPRSRSAKLRVAQKL